MILPTLLELEKKHWINFEKSIQRYISLGSDIKHGTESTWQILLSWKTQGPGQTWTHRNKRSVITQLGVILLIWQLNTSQTFPCATDWPKDAHTVLYKSCRIVLQDARHNCFFSAVTIWCHYAIAEIVIYFIVSDIVQSSLGRRQL